MDPRIKRLVEEIGNQLQQIERQSQQLRDIILFSQEVDRERRDLAVKRLLVTASAGLGNSPIR